MGPFGTRIIGNGCDLKPADPPPLLHAFVSPEISWGALTLVDGDEHQQNIVPKWHHCKYAQDTASERCVRDS